MRKGKEYFVNNSNQIWYSELWTILTDLLPFKFPFLEGFLPLYDSHWLSKWKLWTHVAYFCDVHEKLQAKTSPELSWIDLHPNLSRLKENPRKFWQQLRGSWELGSSEVFLSSPPFPSWFEAFTSTYLEKSRCPSFPPELFKSQTSLEYVLSPWCSNSLTIAASQFIEASILWIQFESSHDGSLDLLDIIWRF